MLGHLTWQRLLLELFVALATALVVSLFTGHLGYCLFVAVLLLLLWHYANMLRLSHWLWAEKKLFPPQGKASWTHIYYGLYKMRLHQRKQRQRLAALISYFREGAESLPDAIVLCDREGHLVWCNHHTQTLLGFRWPQDKTQLVSNLIRLPEFADYLNRRNYKDPLTLILPENRHLELRFIYPYIENNLLIVGRDVTDKFRIEQMRRDFFANISHELKIPLTVLQGYIELLETETPLSETQEHAYTRMQEQVHRLNSMVTQMVALSRLERFSFNTLFTAVDVGAIIQAIEQEYRVRNEKAHQIALNVTPALFALGDADKLHTVISNLFYNAVEHCPNGCKIIVSWQPISNGTRGEFAVEDNGQGIAKEHLPRLTERFYRVDSSRSRASGGSGLGLAIVKHILQHHHTQLIITSVQGKGSRFSFTLPLTEEQKQASSPTLL